MKKQKINIKADLSVYQRVLLWLCLSVVAYLVSLGFWGIGFLFYLITGAICAFTIVNQGNFVDEAQKASRSNILQNEAKKALEIMKVESNQDLVNLLAYYKICFDFGLYTLCLYPLFLFQFDE